MAESKTPITDAVNAEFDAIDQQIDDLKTQTKEVAKEQAKKLKEEIQTMVKKKKEELSDQKTKTDSKPKAAPEAPASISSPDDIASFSQKVVTFCEDTVKFLKEIADAVVATGLDLAKAQTALTERSSKSLGKLTEV